jgi:proteasome assembly chaperone (PAC2) family protein
VKTWVSYLSDKSGISAKTAIAASPGLRSVGKIAVEYLIDELKPVLFARLFSHHFPSVHATIPTYLPSPDLPGDVGADLTPEADIPSVDFFYEGKGGLIFVRGYQANFDGQYEVASHTIETLRGVGVDTVFVLAGHGLGGKGVDVAATSRDLLCEMKRFGLSTGYAGPFLGFSGLTVAMSALRGIQAVCLFSRTTPNLEEPESPDPEAARTLLDKLSEILKIRLDTSKLGQPSERSTPTVGDL